MTDAREKPLRVCIVGSLAPPVGGAAELCRQIAQRLPQAGVQPVFVDVSEHHPGKELPEGVPVVHRGSPGHRVRRIAGRIATFLRYLARFHREYGAVLGGWGAVLRAAETATIVLEACRRHGPVDLVNAHHAVVRGLAGIVVARDLGVPAVLTVYAAEFTGEGANTELAARCCREADRIIGISRFSCELAQGTGAATPADTVYCAVDYELFQPGRGGGVRQRYALADGERLLLYTGWYVARKGPDTLVEALYILNGRGALDKVRCLLCGPDHGLGPALRRRISEYGLQHIAQAPGPVPFEDLVALYQTAYALVFPTRARTEGFGLVAAEAMACGTPVVASNIGAIPEVVADGVTGLLFEPGNAQDLADKLQRLLQDPALRNRMAKEAPQHVREHFHWDRAAAETAAVYRKAVWPV